MKDHQKENHLDSLLENYKVMLQILSESSDDYLFLWDIGSQRVYFAAPERLTLKYDLPSGRNYFFLDEWRHCVYYDDRKPLDDDLQKLIEGDKDSHDMVYHLVDRQQRRVLVHCRAKAIADNNGKPIVMVGRVSEKLQDMRNDSITQLFNQHQMIEDLGILLDVSKTGYLMMIGIDNFKNINDKYGRNFGDDVLRVVARILEENVRYSDTVYRLDGDKFAVILFNAEESRVWEFYNSVKRQINEKVYCTVSAGAAEFVLDGISANQLYQYAENALNFAKEQGKNMLNFFSMADYEKHLFLIDLQEELKSCIRENFQGFEVFFQPQVRQKDGIVGSAEALMRWRSAKHGNIGPDVFVPILEQTGMILDCGQWILHEALAECAKWRQYIPDFHVSVNLSYIQLRDENIVDVVLTELEQIGLPGEALVLELTESIQLQNYDYFNRIFYQLGNYGVQIAIDDFGTGYSSLSYLKRLSVDEIKIDRCFVNQIQRGEYHYKLIRSMIELAQSVKIRVCVEGVETVEEMGMLAELAPELLQGYLFGKPSAIDAFFEQYIVTKGVVLKEVSEQVPAAEAINQPLKANSFEKNLSHVIDELDEIVYISDPETYEMLYLNRGGQRLVGNGDYEGEKCYHILQGYDKPCPFCTNAQLHWGEFLVWENHNRRYNMDFIVKDKLINWKGKAARLEVAVDVTRKENVSYKVQEKLRAEKALVDVADWLIREPDLDLAINQALKIIGEFYQGQRAYIFEIDYESRRIYNTHEWCSEGVHPEINNLQGIDIKEISRWLMTFEQGSNIVISDVADLKEEWFMEYERLAKQDIHSLLAVPFYENGQVVNFVGIDNPLVFDNDYSIVNTMTYFLIAELRRRKYLEKLYFMGYHDAATGVYNIIKYQQDMNAMAEHPPVNLGLIQLDLVELFSQQDDHKGWGDRLIQQVTQTIRYYLKNGDIYRISSIEIMIVFKEISREELTQMEEILYRCLVEDSRWKLDIKSFWFDHEDDIKNIAQKNKALMIYDQKADDYGCCQVRG